MSEANPETEESNRGFWNEWGIIALFASVKLLLHFITNVVGGYGYFRDELYYVACSEHLAAGYVDQPPLSIFILAFNRLVLGDSLFALRLLPAIAGAATVFLAGAIARELGGKKFAQGLACIAVLAAPIFWGVGTFFSMNAFDAVFWPLAAYVLIRLLKTQDTRYWLALGLVLGLGLLNKIGVLWLSFGIATGLVFTSERHWLKTRWPWISAGIAFVLFLPYIIWNVANDFAHLEFIQRAISKYESQTPLTFLAGQFVNKTENGRFRLLGFTYIGTLFVLVVNVHSKPEYLSPAYPVLFAAGSVWLESFLVGKSRQWLKPAYAGLLTVGGATLIPAGLPILPVETYIRYAEVIGLAPGTAEGKQLGALPQFYADMFGWEDKAKAVAEVYHKLSQEDQKKCALFGDNYGRSAAMDFFRKKYGLPGAIGRHNNYWVWGPRGYSGELVIIVGGDLEDKQEVFENVEVVGVVHSEYAMPYENDLRIYVCRNLKVPLDQMWGRLKHYD
ncbi:MAG: glycosyltransferase family 39 protein [Ignavibacteriales bacterium]|nr:glycosyltransferase family 39 protein [Ignavibacteriales bacterium]